MSDRIRRITPGLAIAALALASGCARPGPGAPSVDADLGRMVAGLGDDDYGVRQTAFQRLLDLGEKRPDDVLAALPDRAEDPEVRHRAEVLRRRVPWERYRRNAVELAGTDTHRLAALEYLFDALYDDNAFLTEEDYDPFGHRRPWGDERAALIARAGFLQHDSAIVRMDAIWALEHLRYPDVAADIVPLLRDVTTAAWWQRYGAETSVCEVASIALAGLGTPRLAPEIEDLLDDTEPRIRCAALGALAGIGATSTASRVLPLLDDPHSGVRESAVRTLGALGSRHCRHLLPMLEDPDRLVRRAAVDELGTSRKKEYAGRLVSFLADPEDVVRRGAVSALCRLQNAEVADAVAAHLDDPDANIRRGAVTVLGSLRVERYANDIALELYAEDAESREAAARALSSLARQVWDGDTEAEQIDDARRWWVDQRGGEPAGELVTGAEEEVEH